MLMITRRKNESFVIEVSGELIEITLTEVSMMGNKKQAQLGINAPKKFKVWRKEIFDAMKENEIAAKKSVTPDKLRGIFSQ